MKKRNLELTIEEVKQFKTIELSTYSKCLGDCNGRNTLIWEIRKY
jgi:hypothetical protein